MDTFCIELGNKYQSQFRNPSNLQPHQLQLTSLDEHNGHLHLHFCLALEYSMSFISTISYLYSKVIETLGLHWVIRRTIPTIETNMNKKKIPPSIYNTIIVGL